jgi:hypothetical protein
LPDLTNFIGRPFEKVEESGEEWTILLGDNARITNKDTSKDVPDEDALKGTTFIRPIFSELDTRMQFGVLDDVVYEVVLNPLLYTISDPTFPTGAEEFFPQVPVAIEDTLPEDPSDDRVADGPVEVTPYEGGESENG